MARSSRRSISVSGTDGDLKAEWSRLRRKNGEILIHAKGAWLSIM